MSATILQFAQKKEASTTPTVSMQRVRLNSVESVLKLPFVEVYAQPSRAGGEEIVLLMSNGNEKVIRARGGPDGAWFELVE